MLSEVPGVESVCQRRELGLSLTQLRPGPPVVQSGKGSRIRHGGFELGCLSRNNMCANRKRSKSLQAHTHPLDHITMSCARWGLQTEVECDVPSRAEFMPGCLTQSKKQKSQTICTVLQNCEKYAVPLDHISCLIAFVTYQTQCYRRLA